MKLANTALLHVFGDDSGVLIYNVDSDVSVLLNTNVCKVEHLESDTTFLTISDEAVKKDLTKKGLIVEC